MTKRRDAVGLEQGGSYGGRGREKPLGITAGNHCWNGRGMQILGVILFLCPFTFLCLLFPILNLGITSTCLLPWDVSLDSVTQKGTNTHDTDGRITYLPGYAVINVTPSNSRS